MVCLRLDISRRRLASRVSSGERHCAGRFVQARDINSDFAPHFLTVTLVQDFAMLYSLNTDSVHVSDSDMFHQDDVEREAYGNLSGLPDKGAEGTPKSGNLTSTINSVPAILV